MDYNGEVLPNPHESDQDGSGELAESITQSLLEELLKNKAQDKQETRDQVDILLEGDAKKLAVKLAEGELSKDDEAKLRTTIREAFGAAKVDAFVKYINAELKALKSDYELIVPKQDVFFTLKINMKNSVSGKEAWALDVVVLEPRIG